jgi:hypothetical protein
MLDKSTVPVWLLEVLGFLADPVVLEVLGFLVDPVVPLVLEVQYDMHHVHNFHLMGHLVQH